VIVIYVICFVTLRRCWVFGIEIARGWCIERLNLRWLELHCVPQAEICKYRHSSSFSLLSLFVQRK